MQEFRSPDFRSAGHQLIHANEVQDSGNIICDRSMITSSLSPDLTINFNPAGEFQPARSMIEYVMFGQSGRLGDYIDIVHAIGGQIKKIVVNIPDATDRAGRSFATRLQNYNGWRVRWGIEEEVVVQELKDFSPAENERYILGFSGLGQIPMQNYLADRWGIELDTLVHPSAVVSPTSELGGGCVVNTWGA